MNTTLATLRMVIVGVLCVPAVAVSQQDFPFPAFNDLSVRGFAQEVLYGIGTGRTALFHDSPDSYHIQPAELLERLPVEAAIHQRRLRAAIVIGPYGILWAYDVIALLEDPACARVNRVVMPHARITYKGTGCVPQAQASDWFQRFREQLPLTVAAQAEEAACVAVASYEGDQPTLSYSRFSCHERTDATGILDELRHELDGLLTTTYESYPRVPE